MMIDPHEIVTDASGRLLFQRSLLRFWARFKPLPAQPTLRKAVAENYWDHGYLQPQDRLLKEDFLAHVKALTQLPPKLVAGIQLGSTLPTIVRQVKAHFAATIRNLIGEPQL
jgi:hypothetical protein